MGCVSLLATLCDLLGRMYVYLSGQFAYDINDNCVCMGIALILHSIFKVKQTLQSWLRLRFIQLGIVSRTNHFPAKCAISKQIEKQTNREKERDGRRDREREGEPQNKFSYNSRNRCCIPVLILDWLWHWLWVWVWNGPQWRVFARSFVSIDDCQSEQI